MYLLTRSRFHYLQGLYYFTSCGIHCSWGPDLLLTSPSVHCNYSFLYSQDKIFLQAPFFHYILQLSFSQGQAHLTIYWSRFPCHKIQLSLLKNHRFHYSWLIFSCSQGSFSLIHKADLVLTLKNHFLLLTSPAVLTHKAKMEIPWVDMYWRVLHRMYQIKIFLLILSY